MCALVTGVQTCALPISVRALILAPTRELAVQIGDSFKTYGRNLRLRHAVLLGGVSQGPQVRALSRGVDILIATPGRLRSEESRVGKECVSTCRAWWSPYN